MRGRFVKTKLCPQIASGSRCSRGSKCSYAHGSHEIRDRPHLVKTKLCPDVVNGRACSRINCNYAHAKEELNTTLTERLVNYKTTLCFFNENHRNNDGPPCKYGSSCRFAHSDSELRRSPVGEGLSGSLWARESRSNTPDSATRPGSGDSSFCQSLSSHDKLALGKAILASKYVGCGYESEGLPHSLGEQAVHHLPFKSCNTESDSADRCCSSRHFRSSSSVFLDRFESELASRKGFTPCARGELRHYSRMRRPDAFDMFDIDPNLGDTPCSFGYPQPDYADYLKMELAKQALLGSHPFGASHEVPQFPHWKCGLF